MLAKEATQEMYKTFVQNKNLQEKYPENMMKAMAYFEVFYNQKLKDEKLAILDYNENFPDVKKSSKKSESNKEAYKRIQKDNTKVIKSMIDKATEKKADGGRIGRKMGGGSDMQNTNVKKKYCLLYTSPSPRDP